MCGRFLLDSDYEELIERYQIFEDIQSIYEKRIEILPSQQVLTLVLNDNILRVKRLEWGISTTFKGKKKRVINGRLETASEKTFFKNLLPCIIPCNGYYEWHRSTKEKYLIRSDEALFSFAGLYDNRSEEMLIMTCASGEATRNIHHRMPAILKKEDEDNWLKSRIVDIDRIKSTACHIVNLSDVQQLSFF